jgi:cell division protein FtsQ
VSEGLLPADTVKTVTLQEVFKIASTIEVKVFWKQFTEQLYVDKNKDIILIPKVGSFTIVMGDASRLDEKFNDLEVFINNVLPKVGWEKYKQLSVKYKGQVVTVKN